VLVVGHRQSVEGAEADSHLAADILEVALDSKPAEVVEDSIRLDLGEDLLAP